VNQVGFLHYVVFVVCLFLAAFFCSAETAFIGTQRLRLQHLVRTGHRAAEAAARILEKPEKFLATVLLGINLFETAVATTGTIVAISFWGDNLGAVLATILITLLTLIFAELIPKSLAARHAERLALLYARPVEIISTVLYPVIFVLNHIGIRMTKLTNDGSEMKPTISEAEFHTAIEIGEEEGVVEEGAAEMLHNVFEFGDRRVREIMVPRPEIVFIEKGLTLADFFLIYSQSPRSRLPVYQGNRDNVVGILSAKDVLMGLAKGEINQQSTIDDLVQPAHFTPENTLVSHVFAEMRDHNHHIAVVVDEYGAVSGLVSLDQMTSSIVGPNIGEEEKEYEIVNDNTFQIDGGMRIDEINEQLDLDLPKEDYETIAGFILHLLSRIPKQGEQLKFKNLKIVITKMQGVRIMEVLVTKEVPKIAPGDEVALGGNQAGDRH
jgi:putative hemolysin